jgi:NAD(P)-dependent dehydrogenase (short-subunit alcohol dehydrogenase family)
MTSAPGGAVRDRAAAGVRSAAAQAGEFWRSAVRGQPAGAFTVGDIPDQHGRTVLVTGATSGIGLQSAIALARAGAQVLITARDPGRGEVALHRVAATASGPVPQLIALDLADLASIRTGAETVLGSVDRLDGLIANAGVMATPRGRTVDGFETQIGTNHLGHFALVGRLLPLLRRMREPIPLSQFAPLFHRNRVVVVSSIAHRAGRVLVSDLSGDGRRYSAWGAYSQSKLANLLFARELQHRSDEHGRRLLVSSAHPGLASTNLVAGTSMGALPGIGTIAKTLIGAVGQSDAAGALPLLYAATMPDVQPLEYFGPGGPGEQTGAPVRVGIAPAAADDGTAAALWIVSEKLTGVVYDWS